jgi:hypothetical protein
MTFEEYLIANSHPNKKTSDHVLRMRMTDAGVTFYIHPQGVNGDTADYLVKGNMLSPDPNVTKG